MKNILYILLFVPLFAFGQAAQYTLYSNGISEEVIGETYYDLQTNSAIQNRLFVHEDGTISATWIISPDKLAGFPNRGTGYNYFDGFGWMDIPTSRVEEDRTGWPSISGLNGGEIITSHVFDDPDLFTTIATRPEKGSGDSSESLLPNGNAVAYDNVWPRMKVGGEDGQSIHIISHTYGLDNNYISYSRSQNAGETFDIIDYLIPEIGPEFYNGFGPDQYALDVKGETVAIVIGGAWTDVVLMKSIDNGTTWIKTIVKEHPIPMWNNSIIVDSLSYPEFEGIIESSDQSFSISLDADGNAHIFYGLMNYTNTDTLNDSWSYYPSTDGLAYWNELTQTEEVIASVADLNGNDTLEIELGVDGGALIASYGSTSLTSFPSSAIADNGDIYLIYSSIIEKFYQDQIDLGNYNDEVFLEHYRHQYIMRSQDGGATWSTPYDLMTESTDPVTGNTLQEGVFGCISNIVNDNVYLTYQRDLYPGLNLKGDEDPITKNSIVFMTVPIVSFENGAFLETFVTYNNYEQTGCDSIQSIVDNSFFYQSGIYVDTLINVFNGDSIITQNIIIENNFGDISNNSDTIVEISLNYNDYSTYFITNYNQQNSYELNIIGGNYEWTNWNNSQIKVWWNTLGLGLLELTEITPSGCTNTTSLNINVLPPNYFNEFHLSDCDSVQNIITNNYIYESDLIYDTLINQYGGDSVIFQNISIYHSPDNILINGDVSVIPSTLEYYQITTNIENTIEWNIEGGSIFQNLGDIIEVLWGNEGLGIVELIETGNEGCSTTNILEVNISDESTSIDELNSSKKLIKTINVLGYEIRAQPNTILIQFYDDGSVEKKLIIE